MTKPAVVLCGFNRPDCTQIVFEEIRRYQPEKLLLVADGPRPSVPTDEVRCQSVRAIMQSVDWDCEVQTNFSASNLGCKKRMSSGIDWVFSQVEEAIILEDDCVPCPEFFEFCAEMLERYRDDPRIMSIAGTNFQAGRKRGSASYYFSKNAYIWGWASWRRAWKYYDVEMRSWPAAREEKWWKNLRRVERNYWNTMFEEVRTGKINTWDFQWSYACWKHGGLGIIPNVNLITNIGGGPEATHSREDTSLLSIPTGKLGPIRHPDQMTVDEAADRFVFDTRSDPERGLGFLGKIRRRLSRLKRFVRASPSVF